MLDDRPPADIVTALKMVITAVKMQFRSLKWKRPPVIQVDGVCINHNLVS
jgi:hypothetical protein